MDKSTKRREIQPSLIEDPRPQSEIARRTEDHLAELTALGLIDDPIADGALLRWLASAAENTWAGHAVAKLAQALLEELEQLPAPPAEDDGLVELLADAFEALR